MSSEAASPIEPATRVEIRRLTVRAGSRLLLENAEALFEPGTVTLIVGASGAGKSILLRILAGLIGPEQSEIQVTGSVRLNDREVIDSRVPRSVGVVFQSFALFDELTPTENVRFARAHRQAHAGTSPPDAEGLLAELSVPTDVRTSALSGGQRQRLAVARTLAYDPDVILYDEPTSGLDPATAHRVANLIETTHRAHRKTSIVVTHDYGTLEGIADQIYLLDSESQKLVRIAPEEVAHLAERLAPTSKEPGPRHELTAAARWKLRLASLGRGILDLFVMTSRAFEEAVLLPIRFLPRWRSPYWGARYLVHYLGLIAGPSAWIYLAIAGAIIGFVATYFTFKYLPYAGYTEPLLIENLLASLGFALYRILVPVLGTVLIAARCGAAVASDVGGKVHGQQMDALRSFGARPSRYLLTAIVIAFAIGTPILNGIGFLFAKWTSLVVFTAIRPQLGPDFWNLHFHSALFVPDSWRYYGMGWLYAKVLLCGIGIAEVAYHIGSAPKSSSRAVSLGITTTILWSTLYVLIVHFAFAFFEFE